MTKKAKMIAQDDAATAVDTAIALAKSRTTALDGAEIDGVSGGIIANGLRDIGVTAGLISPDFFE